MNIIKSITTVFLVLALSFNAQAGLFDSAMTSGWDSVESKRYKLEAYGYDARVYEWTPLENPNTRCVFVASNESSGVSCYEVSK